MTLEWMKRWAAWLLRARSYGAVRVARQHGLFGIKAFALLMGIVALAQAVSAGAAPERTLRIVALGDSLTAGFGLPQNAAFPAVLAQALKARGHQVEIVNAGVSGDTASGGLERLDWSVPDDADAVILALGANDMLRGIDPAVTKQALESIVTRLKARGIRVMLAGMYASRNLGPGYVQRFDAIYRDIVGQHGLVFYPFFLEGVAGQRHLNLPDGLHPTAQGVEMIVERMLPSVETFLKELSK